MSCQNGHKIQIYNIPTSLCTSDLFIPIPHWMAEIEKDGEDCIDISLSNLSLQGT